MIQYHWIGPFSGVAPAAKFLSRIRILQLSTRKITTVQRAVRSAAQQAIVCSLFLVELCFGGTNLSIGSREDAHSTVRSVRPSTICPIRPNSCPQGYSAVRSFICPVWGQRRCLRASYYPHKSKEHNQWRTTDGRISPDIASPQYPS